MNQPQHDQRGTTGGRPDPALMAARDRFLPVRGNQQMPSDSRAQRPQTAWRGEAGYRPEMRPRSATGYPSELSQQHDSDRYRPSDRRREDTGGWSGVPDANAYGGRRERMIEQHNSRERHRERAGMLGAVGLIIGLAKLAAPDSVSTLLGLSPSPQVRGTLRVLGVREILQWVGLSGQNQSQENLKAGMWARVAGDGLDAALMAAAATQTKDPMRFALTAVAVTALAALDVVSATGLSDGPDDSVA